MDGGVQPVIAVLGNPIEGNPTQLAIERALDQIGLDWRVLSLNVGDADLDIAIEGLRVCGFHALLIDETLCRRDGADTYFRHEGQWVAERVRQQWLDRLSENYVQTFVQPPDQAEPVAIAAAAESERPEAQHREADEPTQTDGLSDVGDEKPSVVPRGRLHVLERPADLSEDFWSDLGSEDAVVIWPRGGSPETLEETETTSTAAEIIRSQHVRLAVLRDCLRRWTGHDVDVAVMEDAIEEYHSV